MNELPVYRERRGRRSRSLLRQAAQAVLVLVLALLTAFAILTLILFFLFLVGCTAMGAQQGAQYDAAARGCYCAGDGCEILKSAAGHAAVAAAGGQVVNITEVRRPEEP